MMAKPWMKETFPHNPGVYMMKDHEDRVIYIGKAKNLKKRLASYRQKKGQTVKTKHLIEQIYQISFFILNSELEALLLERQLVRLYQPKYNVLLRDDKHLPYIHISRFDDWPRIVEAKIKKNERDLYLGPYPSSWALGQALEAVYSIFPLIRCSPYEFSKRKKPCHYYEMKQCLAPCVGFTTVEKYKKIVMQAESFLKGESEKLRKSIEKSMKKAAQEEDFEQAGRYRDQLRCLKIAHQQQRVIFQDIDNGDLFFLKDEKKEVLGIVLSIRKRLLVGKYQTRFPMTAEEHLGLESFVFDFYQKSFFEDVPEHILFPFETEHMAALGEALEKKSQKKILIKTVETKEELQVFELAKSQKGY